MRTVSISAILLASSVSVFAAGGVLLVANKNDRTVGIIDPATSKQIATIAENGNTAHELVASPDGKIAYVPIYGDSGVGKPGSDGANMLEIDIASRKVIGDLKFDHGVRPHCAQIGPKNGLLYVSTEIDSSITIIDPKSMKIVGVVPTGAKESHMFVISPDGHKAYTANVGPGSVSVIDLDAKKVLKMIPISTSTQRIAVSVDGKKVFTSDQEKPRLAVIDTATDTVESWVALPGLGYGTAATPDGRWLVVAVPTVSQVAVVDLKAMKVTQTIDVPKTPQYVVVRPDGKMAYVSCTASSKVMAIKTSDWTVDATIDAGQGADGLAWAGK